MLSEPILRKGRLVVRGAVGAADHAACQALRSAVFRGGAPDADPFDPRCTHMMVEDAATGALLCCFRLLRLRGATLSESYAAQFYALGALADYDGPMVEVGRFCIAPGPSDPDILRVAWGALTAYVDRHGVQMLFGCSSFKGVDAEVYLDTFALLHERHAGPARWRPRAKAPTVVRFAERLPHAWDMKRALAGMPPLLRTYLMMGGWVSDHAVVDRDLGTLHVFTGLEIAAIPAARKRLLRAVAVDA